MRIAEEEILAEEQRVAEEKRILFLKKLEDNKLQDELTIQMKKSNEKSPISSSPKITISQKKAGNKINTDYDNLSGDLFGAWIISGNYLNDVVSRRANPFFPRRTMKIISGKHFQWVSYNVVTRKFFDAGGGTQTTVNGKYVEDIEYFTKTAKSVGKSVEFSYSVLDGDWRHKGQKSTGGPLDECWTKRNLIEEKFAKK
jgi:hypothetical protein